MKKEFTYKDLCDEVQHLVQTKQMSFTEYLGNGLYRLPGGYAIVNEKRLEEIENLIRNEINQDRKL